MRAPDSKEEALSDRIPLPDLSLLSKEQQRVADEVAAGPRGEVRGPVRVWLHSPELAQRAQKLGEFLRWGTALEGRISELVILTTARHYNCHYIWRNHVSVALKSGLKSDTIECIKNGLEPKFVRDDEIVAFSFTREVLEHHDASDAILTRARHLFTDRGVVELGSIIGH